MFPPYDVLSISTPMHFHIRPALTESMAATLGASLVQSKWYNVSFIMYGMTPSNMHKLVCSEFSYSCGSAFSLPFYSKWVTRLPPLASCLLLKQFKTATLTYKTLATCQPPYLYNTCLLILVDVPLATVLLQYVIPFIPPSKTVHPYTVLSQATWQLPQIHAYRSTMCAL